MYLYCTIAEFHHEDWAFSRVAETMSQLEQERVDAFQSDGNDKVPIKYKAAIEQENQKQPMFSLARGSKLPLVGGTKYYIRWKTPKSIDSTSTGQRDPTDMELAISFTVYKAS